MPRIFAASRGASNRCVTKRSSVRGPKDIPALVRDSIRFYAYLYGIARLTRLISQWLAGFESVRDALLRFPFAAERDERFALEIEYVLFADELRSAQRAARENVRQLSSDDRVVFRGITAAQQKMNRHFRGRQKLLAQDFDLCRLRPFLPTSRRRLVAATNERKRSFL